MPLSYTTTLARQHCENGKTNEAVTTLDVTWDDLLDRMAEFNRSTPSGSTVNDLVTTICLRNFVDRERGINNRKLFLAMLERLRTYLTNHPDDPHLCQLRCVVLANMADDYRRAEAYRYADELFATACTAVPAASPTGAVAAMMRGLLWLEAQDQKRAEHYLVAAGKVIVCRRTLVPKRTHALLATILVHICRRDFEVLFRVLGLTGREGLPPTDGQLLTQLNAGTLGAGPGAEEFWPTCYVPLLAALG